MTKNKSKRKKVVKNTETQNTRTYSDVRRINDEEMRKILEGVGMTPRHEDEWLRVARRHEILNEGVELFMSTSDMSPKIAVTATLMSLASMTRREQRVVVMQGSPHLNLWATVIGISGWARKTTAEKILTKLVKEAEGEFLPANFTPEAIISHLSKKAQGLIVKDEISGLIKAFRKDHNADLPEVLSEIYECKDRVERHTISRGLEVVENAYVNWWGGTAVHYIRLLRDDDWNQGFMHRWIYCLDIDLMQKKVRPLVFTSAELDTRIQDFAQTLKKVREVPVETLIPAEKTKKFKTLEQESFEKAKQYYSRDIFDIAHPYFARVPITTLKIAGILQVADLAGKGSTLEQFVITPEIMDLASDLMRLYLQEFEALVAIFKRTAISAPPTTDRRNLGYFIETLRSLGGVARQQELLTALGFSYAKYQKLLDTLVERGDVDVGRVAISDQKGAPPRLIWLRSYASNLGDAEQLWVETKELRDKALRVKS